jgi:hypothetical protein
MRPFGLLSKQDILNEARAIDKLSKYEQRNIVKFLRHGWLGSTYYFLDMELCDFSLEDFIGQGDNGREVRNKDMEYNHSNHDGTGIYSHPR